MSNAKFGAKEVMDVVLYDMETDKPVIQFDSLKTSSISVTSEKVYARGGKGNPKLITWEINKEATLTIEDALISPKSLELISGIARKVGVQTIRIRQTTEYDENGNYIRDYPDGYDLYQSLTVTSTDIDKVEQISRDITQLIESGVQFVSNSPEYYCTTLDEVKLDLIQKATENAKQRIDIMAAGTGCQPGKLLSASLGVFQITAKNSGSGEYTYDGAFDTSSREKTAMITVRLNYAAEE